MDFGGVCGSISIDYKINNRRSPNGLGRQPQIFETPKLQKRVPTGRHTLIDGRIPSHQENQ